VTASAAKVVCPSECWNASGIKFFLRVSCSTKTIHHLPRSFDGFQKIFPFLSQPQHAPPCFQCLQPSPSYPPGFLAILPFSTLPSPFPISTCFLSVSEPNVPSYQEGAHDSSFEDTETQNIRLVMRLHSHSPIKLYIRTDLPILFPRICILVNENYVHIFVLIHVWHICKLTSN